MYLYLNNIYIKTKKLFIIAVIMALPTLCLAQDVYFSQYNNTPLLINPALTGESSGNGRIIMNYRNQWSSITNNPFKTYSFSADYSLFKNKLSAGILILKDHVGIGNMNNTQASFSLATKVKLSNNKYLKAGILSTWSLSTVNKNNFTWNNQFDGDIINPALNSGETFFIEKSQYFDLSAGALLTHIFENKNKINIGLSMYHLTQPSYSFYNNNEHLNMRINTHIDATIQLKDKLITLHPSALFMSQGINKFTQVGTALKYNIGNTSRYTGFSKSSSIMTGVYYRHLDAILIYTQFNYQKNIDIGISYDINVSKLHNASKSYGAFEVTLMYVFLKNTFIKLK